MACSPLRELDVLLAGLVGNLSGSAEFRILDGGAVVRCLTLLRQVVSGSSVEAVVVNRIDAVERSVGFLQASIQGFEEHLVPSAEDDGAATNAPDPFAFARDVQLKLDALEERLQQQHEGGDAKSPALPQRSVTSQMPASMPLPGTITAGPVSVPSPASRGVSVLAPTSAAAGGGPTPPAAMISPAIEASARRIKLAKRLKRKRVIKRWQRAIAMVIRSNRVKRIKGGIMRQRPEKGCSLNERVQKLEALEQRHRVEIAQLHKRLQDMTDALQNVAANLQGFDEAIGESPSVPWGRDPSKLFVQAREIQDRIDQAMQSSEQPPPPQGHKRRLREPWRARAVQRWQWAFKCVRRSNRIRSTLGVLHSRRTGTTSVFAQLRQLEKNQLLTSQRTAATVATMQEAMMNLSHNIQGFETGTFAQQAFAHGSELDVAKKLAGSCASYARDIEAERLERQGEHWLEERQPQGQQRSSRRGSVMTVAARRARAQRRWRSAFALVCRANRIRNARGVLGSRAPSQSSLLDRLKALERSMSQLLKDARSSWTSLLPALPAGPVTEPATTATVAPSTPPTPRAAAEPALAAASVSLTPPSPPAAPILGERGIPSIFQLQSATQEGLTTLQLDVDEVLDRLKGCEALVATLSTQVHQHDLDLDQQQQEHDALRANALSRGPRGDATAVRSSAGTGVGPFALQSDLEDFATKVNQDLERLLGLDADHKVLRDELHSKADNTSIGSLLERLDDLSVRLSDSESNSVLHEDDERLTALVSRVVATQLSSSPTASAAKMDAELGRLASDLRQLLDDKADKLSMTGLQQAVAGKADAEALRSIERVFKERLRALDALSGSALRPAEFERMRAELEAELKREIVARLAKRLRRGSVAEGLDAGNHALLTAKCLTCARPSSPQTLVGTYASRSRVLRPRHGRGVGPLMPAVRGSVLGGGYHMVPRRLRRIHGGRALITGHSLVTWGAAKPDIPPDVLASWRQTQRRRQRLQAHLASTRQRYLDEIDDAAAAVSEPPH